jgi:hypothetical protein
VSEFGKEVGLVHEMIITGRSAGAGALFFTFLSQDKESFTRIARLVNLQAVIKQVNHSLKKVEDFRAVDDLIEVVSKVVHSSTAAHCMSCPDPGWRASQHLYVPEEVLREHKAERDALPVNEQEECLLRQEEAYSKYFFNHLIGDRLRAIGIHPAELAFAFRGVESDEKGWLTSGGCCSAEDFAVALKGLVTLHNLLFEIEATL